MSERFDTPVNKNNATKAESSGEKYLNLPFFYSKLFWKDEMMQITEVDHTLQMIKAALIYKGVDFGNIFAEQTADDTKQKGQRRTANIKPKDDGKIDLMCHYSRFAQQIMKKEFVDRIETLNATGVTTDKTMRLANYLSLN